MAVIKTAKGSIVTNSRVILSRKVSDIGNISTAQGSLTRSFDVAATNNHKEALGVAMNLSKPVQSRLIECSVFDDAEFLFAGLLSVEKVNNDVISCRIYEGNTEWLARLKGVSLKDLDLGTLRYSPANVGTTQAARSGAFWGIFNTGVNDNTLFFNQKTILDVLPCMFVKDVMARAFSFAGVAVKGDLWENPDFESLVLVLGDKIVSQADATNKEDYTCQYSGTKTVSGSTGTTPVKIEPDTIIKDSAFLSLSGYTPDVPLVVLVRFSFELSAIPALGTAFLRFYTNAGTFVWDFDLNTLASPNNAPIPLDNTNEFFIGIINNSGSPIDVTVNASYSVLAISEFDINLASFAPDIKAETLINTALSLFTALSNYDSNTNFVTLTRFASIADAPVQDVSALIDTRSIEQDFAFDLGFENTLTYAETENEESIGNGSFIIDKEFLKRTNEFLSLDFAGSYYRLSFSVSETLVTQNYFRENTIIPFEVSAPVPTTQVSGLKVGDKFVIYPFGIFAGVNVNDLHELEAFEVLDIGVTTGQRPFVFAYSYLQNNQFRFIFSDSLNNDVTTVIGIDTAFLELDALVQFSKVSHKSLEPRILVAGEQVPDVDIDIFSPVGVPPEVLDRIEIQRTAIRPKHLYFARPLQTWTAPIYQTTYSPAFDSTGTRDVSTKSRYWSSFVEMLRDGREVTISIRLNGKSFRELDLLRPVFVAFFQSRFVIRELKYEVGEDLHEVRLIKI